MTLGLAKLEGMDGRVLILNRGFQPVNVVDVRRAMCMLYLGVARALDQEYRQFDFESWSELSTLDAETIRTSSRAIRVPRIMVLQLYERIPVGRIRFSRHNIYVRDNHTCQYCRKSFARSDLNLDHVIPRSQGGGTNWENVVTSCIPCNRSKGCKTPEQARMKLKKKPTRPGWSELMRRPSMRARYREWLPFLDPVNASYWNAELESD